MNSKLISFDEMKKRTKEFYESLDVIVSDEHIEEAVISLSMAQYVKEFNENKNNINKNISLKNNHKALSTVGDAVCEAYWMLNKYRIDSSQEILTDEKTILRNDHLNIIGKKMLEGRLFATNNDLDSNNEIENKKSYATAFEAIIGFVSLINLDKAFEILQIYLK